MNHIHSYLEGYYIQIIKVSIRMEVFMYFLKKIVHRLTDPHINMVNIWGLKQCMEAQTCFRSLSIHGMYHYYRNSYSKMNLFYGIRVRVLNDGYVITK